MKIRNYLLVIAAVFLAACKDDFTDPFGGTDNYITSFALTMDGATYPGVFEDDTIVMPLREGASLYGAVATVRLSERAAIYPDPASIHDWRGEQQFAVVSYSGARRVYLYVPRLANVVHEGDVALETQADVDAFAALGVTAINGNLIIGRASGEDSISSTAALAALKRVEYDLVINNRVNGETLAFENLEEAGSITISAAYKWVVFPRLRQVNLSASFGSQYSLQCPDLEVVGKNLSAQNASTLDNGFDFPNLKRVGGTLQLTNTVWRVNAFSLPKLEAAGAVSLSISASQILLPALKTCAGAFTASNANTLEIELPALETVGSLTMSGAKYMSFDLPALASATTLSLTGATAAYFNLPALTSATTLTLSGAAAARVDLPLLERVGTLTATNLTALETLSLPALRAATRINVPSSAKLHYLDLRAVTVDYLNLSSVDSIRIEGTGTISNTLGLSSVRHGVIAGFTTINTLSISSCESASLPDATRLTGNATIYFYDGNKIALPKLKTVEGNFSFTCYSESQPAPSEVDFGSLESIGGSLTVSGSTTYNGLTNLDMFAALASVPSATVTNQKNLVSYEGLKNAIASVKTWRATGNKYNPTLQNLLDGKWIME
ncbi:MAG: hypothetical protein LBK12_05015 [Odoribacteraceae bacterium]|jgi:hypothetical protein|nr:hypothetical protein [Odoribacteraceae bacterium]